MKALRTAAILVAVGLVLSDSSIVVLALPEIFREFDTSVEGVSWVLISFNLALALIAVPGAMAARRLGPGRTAALGPYLRFYNHQRPHTSLGRRSPWMRFQEAA